MFCLVETVSRSSTAWKAVSTQVGGQLTNPSATVQGGEGGSGFGEQSKGQSKETYGTNMEIYFTCMEQHYTVDKDVTHLESHLFDPRICPLVNVASHKTYSDMYRRGPKILCISKLLMH